MDSKNKTSSLLKVDLSIVYWFLFSVILWELLFNRLAWAIGFYRGVGAEGVLSFLASSGRFAMASSGIMALILTCIGLPQIAGDSRFGSISLRAILVLTSPFYIPVVCVSIFRPVSSELIIYSYIAASFSGAFLFAMTIARDIDSSSRRFLIVLLAIQIIEALEKIAEYSQLSEEIIRNIYFFSEALFLAAPVFGFFMLAPRPLVSFLKHPHMPGLFFAGIITCFTALIAIFIQGAGLLQAIAYRTMGMTIPLKGTAWMYVVAMFFGSLLIGSSILPSKKWPPDEHRRRLGLGLLAIWSSGIQPVRPYQFILVVLGFIYISRGVIGMAGEPLRRT